MDVLIVDDHLFIHETLSAVVKGAVPGATVHTDTGITGAFERVRQLERLDLVLLDLGLPGYTGIEALKHFRKSFPHIRVAIVSAAEEPERVRDALAAGAAGYIPKTTSPSVMVAAVRLIAEGGTYVPAQIMAASQPPAPGPGDLTQRQTEVLRLLVKGLANRQIAERLEISENTAKQHAHALFGKLGVSSRTEAVAAAGRLGIKPE